MPEVELSPEEAISAEGKVRDLIQAASDSVPENLRKKTRGGMVERDRTPIELRNAFHNEDDLLLSDSPINILV